jgi:hypothetical protein
VKEREEEEKKKKKKKKESKIVAMLTIHALSQGASNLQSLK